MEAWDMLNNPKTWITLMVAVLGYYVFGIVKRVATKAQLRKRTIERQRERKLQIDRLAEERSKDDAPKRSRILSLSFQDLRGNFDKYFGDIPTFEAPQVP